MDCETADSGKQVGSVSLHERDPFGSRGVPRGLMRNGPIILSYGFRPFFLGAGCWAIMGMATWLAMINGSISLADRYGQVAWHAHELLFGFMPAALVGYMMITLPNWTGKFPLSGKPLAALVSLWLSGRAAMLAIDVQPILLWLAIDWLFLPVMLLFCLREIRAARRLPDIKPILALVALTGLNTGFHVSAMSGATIEPWVYGALSVYLVLVTATSTKLVPSLTNSWLAKAGKPRLPPSDRKLDAIALITTVVAGLTWTLMPERTLTIIVSIICAIVHLIRSKRWFSRHIVIAPMVLATQLAYAALSVGLLTIALSGLGSVPSNVAVHFVAIGAVSGMILAVMSRSIRLQTARNEKATWPLVVSNICLVCAAIIRATADLFADLREPMVVIAGSLWIAAFVLFLVDAAPLLISVRRDAERQISPPARMNIR